MASINIRELSVALVSGTGRMGVHLAAAWAHAGMDVIVCSRSKSKAQEIVNCLLAGNGYSDGDIMVPPSDACDWRLRAGGLEDAAAADVIALASPFHVMWNTIEPIAPLLHGKGKVFLDLTNPFLNTSDKSSEPIPKDMPQASVLVHKQLFNDPSSAWCHCYRHIFWMLIHPTGPNPRCGPTGIEVLGDPAAVNICSAMIKAHGFEPVVREGGVDVAPLYEVSFSGRVMKDQGAPPGPGQDSDGLVGPFNASPMIGLDIMAEKISRWFRASPPSEPAQKADQDKLQGAVSQAVHDPSHDFTSVMRALKEGGWSERKAAAETLRDMGPAAAGAVHELRQVLQSDTDWGTRRAAAEALGKIGSAASDAAPELRQATKDSDWTVRKAAEEALQSINA